MGTIRHYFESDLSFQKTRVLFKSQGGIFLISILIFNKGNKFPWPPYCTGGFYFEIVPQDHYYLYLEFISAGHSYVDVVQMKMKLLIIYRQLRLWKIVAIVTELH